MSFLKRWRASQTNLYAPDVGKAPYEQFDLSGTIIRFKRPPHSSNAPLKPTTNQLDINSNSSFDDLIDRSDCYASLLCRTGWSFLAGMAPSDSFGELMMHIVLNKTVLPNKVSESFFKIDNHLDWTLKMAEASYGFRNNDMLLEFEGVGHDLERFKEQRYYRYPKTLVDVEIKLINGFNWLTYPTFKPGYPKTHHFRSAISHSHSILIIYQPVRHIGDYFSPDSNLPEVVDKTISDIMNTMEIHLSPEAELNRKEALSDAT